MENIGYIEFIVTIGGKNINKVVNEFKKLGKEIIIKDNDFLVYKATKDSTYYLRFISQRKISLVWRGKLCQIPITFEKEKLIFNDFPLEVENLSWWVRFLDNSIVENKTTIFIKDLDTFIFNKKK